MANFVAVQKWPEHSGGGIPPEMELSYHRLIYGGGLPLLAVWSKIVTSLACSRSCFPFHMAANIDTPMLATYSQ